VQATWIGYPNTTGLDAIDYRITDAISDPPGQTEAYYSEKLLRLPTAFSCYRPDDEAPPVNELPAASNPGVTFASLNQFAKVTPAVVAVWSRILQALPHSRLLLKVPGRSDPDAANHVLRAFAETGVGPAQLVLQGDRLPTAAHLSLYHRVDIALDPFPYNGTTTSCEALWMGVPVLTLAGSTHVARVGASLMTHLGLPDWIAANEEEYLARALSAATDCARLAALRTSLRERMRASPVCDPIAFTRNLEEAFARLAAR
jgi:predicted O-linked N-acetylglucosamine transferase (SPINDLY family)